MTDNNNIWAVASKPLQILNLLNIWLGSEEEEQLTLCIVDAFEGARTVYQNLNSCNIQRLQLIFVPDYLSVHRESRGESVDTFYIDTDIGFWRRTLIFLMRSKKTIVYEEGFGTYDLFRFGPKGIFKSYFGAYIQTSGLVVYHPEELHPSVAHKGIAFPHSLQEFIEANWDLACAIMLNPKYDDRLTKAVEGEVAVYFTRRKLDRSNLNELSQQVAGTLVVRPHPGLIDILDTDHIRLNRFYSGEIEILSLLSDKRVSKVTIYHHGTSMQRYIQHEALHYVRLKLINGDDK